MLRCNSIQWRARGALISVQGYEGVSVAEEGGEVFNEDSVESRRRALQFYDG